MRTWYTIYARGYLCTASICQFNCMDSCLKFFHSNDFKSSFILKRFVLIDYSSDDKLPSLSIQLMWFTREILCNDTLRFNNQLFRGQMANVVLWMHVCWLGYLFRLVHIDIIMVSSKTYFRGNGISHQWITQYCNHSSRTWMRLETHNRHPIPRPNGRATGCILWGNWKKKTDCVIMAPHFTFTRHSSLAHCDWISCKHLWLGITHTHMMPFNHKTKKLCLRHI